MYAECREDCTKAESVERVVCGNAYKDYFQQCKTKYNECKSHGLQDCMDQYTLCKKTAYDQRASCKSDAVVASKACKAECITQKGACFVDDKVCGVDDKTYSNECELNFAGVQKQYNGECLSPSPVCMHDFDCNLHFSSCSCSWTCLIDISRFDCARACEAKDMVPFQPVCSCIDHQCAIEN